MATGKYYSMLPQYQTDPTAPTDVVNIYGKSGDVAAQELGYKDLAAGLAAGKSFGNLGADWTPPGSGTAPIVDSTSGIRKEYEQNKSEAGDLLGQLGDLQSSGLYSETEAGKAELSDLDKLKKAMGILTPEEEAAITKEETSRVSGMYDPLIAAAEAERRKGLPKALIGAGEVGGLMNTQFAGLAALTPTQGGDFFGAGGQLEDIKSAYDANIQSLQVKKSAAIAEAIAAAKTARLTGKRDDFKAAQEAFNDAQARSKDVQDMLMKKTETISQLQTASLGRAQTAYNLAQDVGGDVASGLVSVDDKGNVVPPTDEEMQKAFQDSGMGDYNAFVGAVNARIDELTKIAKEDRKEAYSQQSSSYKEWQDLANAGLKEDYITWWQKNKARKAATGGGGGGGGGGTTAPGNALSFKDWYKGKYGSEPELPEGPDKDRRMDKMVTEYNAYLDGFYSSVSQKQIDKLLSPGDAKKMISQGLNPTNAKDVYNFINSSYKDSAKMTASSIDSGTLGNLIDDINGLIASGGNVEELFDAYPNVSTSYIVSLYKQLE